MAMNGSSAMDGSSARIRAELQNVLAGGLNLDHSPPSRTIRVFISSDISDTHRERILLRKEVFPHLHSLAHSLGLHLHIVDPFQLLDMSGANEDSNTSEINEDKKPDNSQVMLPYHLEQEGFYQLMLDEIKLCAEISAGPAFLTLLSQKYGHRPLPRSITEEDYPLLLAVIEDREHRYLVREHYALDSNACPPHYILQEGTSDDEWPKVHETLSKVLARAAKVALGKQPSKVQCYITSAIEEEVTQGIFNSTVNPNMKCLWFKRTFTDLYNQWPGGGDSSVLAWYSDIVPGRRGLEFDSESLKSLNYLKEARMTAKYVGLDSSNVLEFPVQWQKGKGLDPESNPAHLQYTTNFTQSFFDTVKEKMIIAATNFATISAVQGKVYQEAFLHLNHCKNIAEKVSTKHCSEIMIGIQNYLNTDTNTPLIVHGETGAGKSSIIAAVVKQLLEKTKDHESHEKSTILIVRFVGLTTLSCSIKKLLNSISDQICEVFQCPPIITTDYTEITERFADLLTSISHQSKKLFMFIDGVDHLEPDNGALGLSWLPLSLPSGIKLVISTSSETQYRCYPVLKSLVPTKTSFIEVPSLTGEQCRELLNHCLSLSNRQLTAEQEAKALLAITQCPIPAYIKLMYQQAVKWSSIQSINERPIVYAKDLKGALVSRLESLEQRHGHVLVYHTLAYLATAKFGLSETEILDLLSLDKEVLNELNGKTMAIKFSGPLPEVPSILWSMLLHDLLDGVVEFSLNEQGVTVLRCSNRSLREAISEHYLQESQAVINISSKLADYFNSNVTPDSVAEKSSSSKVLRSINRQPLILNFDQHLYNTSKLIQLPCSMSLAKSHKDLQQLLSSHNWLKACTDNCVMDDILKDFSSIIPAVPIGSHSLKDMAEFRLLHGALSLSLNAITREPTQFSQQLTGRLLPYITNKANEMPLLKQLVSESLELSTPGIVPIDPFQKVPGGPLLLTMAGHRDTVTTVAASIVERNNGGPHLTIVSGSSDKSLRSWDWRNSGVIKTFDGHQDEVLSLALTKDGHFAASGGRDKSVRYWEVCSATCLHVMEGHQAAVTAVALVSDGGKTVSGSLDSTIKIWNTDQKSRCKGELIFTMNTNKSPLLCLSLSEVNQHLVVGMKKGSLMLVDVVSGEILQRQSHSTSDITSVAIAHIEQCNEEMIVSGSVDCSLVVWNAELKQHVHLLTAENPVSNVAVSSNGLLVSTHHNRVASVWDIITGVHLFNLTRNATDIVSVCLIDEGRLAITGSSDATLNIWDLTSPPLQSNTLNPIANECLAVSPCGTYTLSSSQISTTITVYETQSMSVVRKFEQLKSESTCILVLRDSQHFIAGHKDGSLSLCNGRTEEVFLQYTGHEGKVNCLSVSNDSLLLITGADDCQVIIWSVQKGTKLKTFVNHKEPIVAVHFTQNSNSKFIISGDKSGAICVRDFTTANEVTTMTPYSNQPTSISVSVSGKVLVAGYEDGCMMSYSLPLLNTTTVFRGHAQSISSVHTLPHNRCLTASDDAFIKIWNLEFSEPEAVLAVNSPVMTAVADPISSTVVYGCSDGYIGRCWYRKKQEVDPILRQLRGELDEVSLATSLSTSSNSATECDHQDVSLSREEGQESPGCTEMEQDLVHKVNIDTASSKSIDQNSDKNEEALLNELIELKEELNEKEENEKEEEEEEEEEEESDSKQKGSKTCTIL